MAQSKVDVYELDNLTALRDFLLKIDCLDALSERASKFNLFDVLKVSREELVHSNVLSWLLNPNENHGLGDGVIRGFIQFIVTSCPNNTEVFKTLLMDYHSFYIQREWRNTDILAVSREEKFVLCIENKIDSGEHDGQLPRYWDTVEDEFKDYTRKYIFLSPKGIASSDTEKWPSMGYCDVLNIIEKAKKNVSLSQETEVLINNYIDILRREIVEDDKIAEICAEIYTKHKKALDLIYEYKPDKAAQLASIFRTWAKKKAENNELIYDPQYSIKTCIRFTTKEMSALLPDSEDKLSERNTKNFYFYEIVNDNKGDSYRIVLAVFLDNIPDDLKSKCSKLYKSKHPDKELTNSRYWHAFSVKTCEVKDDFSEEEIYKKLDKQLEKIKEYEREARNILKED